MARSQTETLRVSWAVDIEVPLGTLDRDVALLIADKYFQQRIAEGEVDSACVFKVDGREVDLAIKHSPQMALAEAAARVLDEFQAIEDSGDVGLTLDMDGKSSIIALKRLIKQVKEEG